MANQTKIIDADGHVFEDHEAIARSLRTEISTVGDRCGDVGTEDFLTGLLERHEKMAWMLRAFLNRT